jgi:hypothetical protein
MSAARLCLEGSESRNRLRGEIPWSAFFFCIGFPDGTSSTVTLKEEL